jgi:hypothetical protein
MMKIVAHDMDAVVVTDETACKGINATAEYYNNVLKCTLWMKICTKRHDMLAIGILILHNTRPQGRH